MTILREAGTGYEQPENLSTSALLALVLKTKVGIRLTIVQGESVAALILYRTDARDDDFVPLCQDLLEQRLLGQSVGQL